MKKNSRNEAKPKSSNYTTPRYWIPVLLTALLLPAGCGEKKVTEAEEAAQVEEDRVETIRTDVPPPLAAPKIYTDAGKQKRFESLFTNYLTAFVPPQPGTLIRADTKSGGRLEGEMARYTAEGIVIVTPDGFITLNRNEMTEHSQQQLFPGAFSQQLAESQMAIDAAEGGPADPSLVFFPPADQPVVGVRRFTADRIKPYLGPGRHYAQVEGVEIFRGQNIYVVDERDGWIAIKDTEEAPRSVGWIPKYSSFITNPENRDAVAQEVETLIKDGFIIGIDPRKNEALVDFYQWRISDSASVEGKSRLLAFYCGQQKGVRLFWVDIKDAVSGRRLAEYSESKGFKVY